MRGLFAWMTANFTREAVLATSGSCALVSVSLAFYLIRGHLRHFSKPSIQPKIIAIVYMVPIYSIDSFLSLLFPYAALYINMLRDCYEAYVLYLFLSLMMSYLGCEDDDSEVVAYLNQTMSASDNYSQVATHDSRMSVGKKFLRTCKFGTLQYCVIRPSTALAAILLNLLGMYDESDFSVTSGHFFLLLLLNISVAYAFYVLANFYYALKDLLQPFEPVGKFLTIKFVIFVAFWQSVAVAILVHLDVITGMGDYGPEVIATGLQDYLICVEMMMVSVVHLYVFSYLPFAGQQGFAAYKHLPGTEPAGGRHAPGYSPPQLAAVEARVFSVRPPGRGAAFRSGPGRPSPADEADPEDASALLDKHFATSAAIRDFNEAMPVVVLPSTFQAKRGVVVRSDPSQRLRELNP